VGPLYSITKRVEVKGGTYRFVLCYNYSCVVSVCINNVTALLAKRALVIISAIDAETSTVLNLSRYVSRAQTV